MIFRATSRKEGKQQNPGNVVAPLDLVNLPKHGAICTKSVDINIFRVSTFIYQNLCNVVNDKKLLNKIRKGIYSMYFVVSDLTLLYYTKVAM